MIAGYILIYINVLALTMGLQLLGMSYWFSRGKKSNARKKSVRVWYVGVGLTLVALVRLMARIMY